jgi:hypothetical protein
MDAPKDVIRPGLPARLPIVLTRERSCAFSISSMAEAAGMQSSVWLGLR